MEYKNQTENRAFQEMLQAAVKRLQNRSGEDLAAKSGAVFHSSRNVLEVLSFYETIEIQLPEFRINSNMDEWHYLTLLHYLDMADGTEGSQTVSYTHLDVYKRQAQYWGKGDKKTVERILGLAERISLIVSLVFFVISFSMPTTIMKMKLPLSIHCRQQSYPDCL